MGKKYSENFSTRKKRNCEEISNKKKKTKIQNDFEKILDDKDITQKILPNNKKIANNRNKNNQSVSNQNKFKNNNNSIPAKRKFQNQMRKRNQHDFKYEENEIMTYFENYWIPQENLQEMKILSEENKNKIIEKRKDGNNDPNLTSEEEQIYKVMMKSAKKKQVKKLKLKIVGNKNINRSIKLKKPGKYLGINFEANDDLVKFNGHFIKKDGHERIIKLCEIMRENGSSEKEIAQVIKSERRKEEKRLKKEHKLKFPKPQPSNNFLSLSPSNNNEAKKNDDVACFRCNSTGHFARNCPENDTSNSLSSRACYNCNEVGHISRNCPSLGATRSSDSSNKKRCDECESEEHLRRDCPKRQINIDSTRMCYKCSEVGHISSSCPTMRATSNKNINKIIYFDD